MKKLKKFQHLTATVKGLPAVVIQPGLKCKRGKCKEAPNMLAVLTVVLLVIVNGLYKPNISPSVLLSVTLDYIALVVDVEILNWC